VTPRNSTLKASLPHPKVSSGKLYLIAHYVTCNRFSYAYRCYLATIDKIGEPKFFRKKRAVKDSKLRDAMSKEIEALKRNNT